MAKLDYSITPGSNPTKTREYGTNEVTGLLGR